MEVCSVLNSIQKKKKKQIQNETSEFLPLSLFYFLFLSTSMFFVFTRLPPFKSEDQIFDKFEKFCAFERTRVVTNHNYNS